jgi:hypothetical protein
VTITFIFDNHFLKHIGIIVFILTIIMVNHCSFKNFRLYSSVPIINKSALF